MRISEVTSSNKPYIRIVRGKKRVDIPITPKTIVLPPNKASLRDYGYVGCETIRVNYKGKTVKINWAFNHNKMTLYCSSGHKAYSWHNVKIATVTNAKGKKEHLVVCKRPYGTETERRRFKRYPLVKSIIISQGDNSFNASTVDLSFGGVGIALKNRINIIPSEPIIVNFDDSTTIRARLVRTVFKEDGSEILGCSVSKVYKYEMAKMITQDEARINQEKEEAAKAKKQAKETDAGWTQESIKRWH